MDEQGFGAQVDSAFAAAIDVPRDKRAAFLDAQRLDPSAREEVESLLVAHDSAEGFLTLDPPHADARDRRIADDDAGLTIGAFRLIERIGEGAMGAVYRAERADGEFTQRVAIKLLDTPFRRETLRRFRTERQILASLHHPNIVTLLDGGVTDEGRAYLVMECVDGVPISTYCAEHTLALQDRLQLFCDVCGAVQHAHQLGIVHRDLKPANILVEAGTVKVLDFGIAKLVDRTADAADATKEGFGALTPNYASPEQLRGQSVTTASDIYALGVLLYELLAGVRPYETAAQTLDRILAVVLNTDPPRPSERADPSRIPYHPKRLRGDLDAVALKALSKDPAGRYASADEMAADIGRHLAGRPVLAREPSFGYVARSLARRHRAGVAAAAVSVIALVGALGVSLWQTRIAMKERNRATERFNDVRHLANALIFKIHDGVQPLAGSTPVRQSIVAEALTYLERLSRDPASDVPLRLELAKGYHRIGDVQGNPAEANLGDREGALASYTKGAGLLRPLVSDRVLVRDAALEFGALRLAVARVSTISGAREEAVAAARETQVIAELLARREVTDDEAQRLLGRARFELALALGAVESLPEWRRAAEIFNRLLEKQPDDPIRQRDVALVEKYLGSYYEQRDDFGQALVHHVKAQELDERRLAADPSSRRTQLDVAIDLSNVAFAYSHSGRLADAAAGYEGSLEIRRRLAESDPRDALARSRLAYVHSRLGDVYGQLGRYTDALRHAEEAVRISESQAAIDPTHVELFAVDLHILGRVQRWSGRLGAACQTFRRSAAVLSGLGPKEIGESSNLAKRIHNDLNRLGQDLASCGPRPGAASHAREP